MKPLYLDVPQGTKEYVVIVPVVMPDGVDPESIPAEMSLVPRDEEPVTWEAASWVADAGGWGRIVDTADMEGEYDVRVRLDYGDEAPVLGPARLRVFFG